MRLGERVRITGEDFPGRSLEGQVVEVSPIAEGADSGASGRTVATTIAVDAPPAFLRDGMSVDADILTTDLRDAMVVPERGARSRRRRGLCVRRPRRHCAPSAGARGRSNEGGSVIVRRIRRRRRRRCAERLRRIEGRHRASRIAASGHRGAAMSSPNHASSGSLFREKADRGH